MKRPLVQSLIAGFIVAILWTMFSAPPSPPTTQEVRIVEQHLAGEDITERKHYIYSWAVLESTDDQVRYQKYGRFGKVGDVFSVDLSKHEDITGI